MTRILFTVSNDLNFDQRMIKICTSLKEGGFHVELLGFEKNKSPELNQMPYVQKRNSLFFSSGKFFYLEIQIRLFFSLLFSKCDIICAVDMDTILPAYVVSIIRSKKLVLDAHEYFSETSGLVGRNFERKVWQWLEKLIIPRLFYGYTVNDSLAKLFKERFQTEFSVIHNFPVLKEQNSNDNPQEFFLYQGALNKGRGLMEILNAFKHNSFRLKIAGDGPLKAEILNFIAENKIEARIEFLGWLNPDELAKLTSRAWAGLNLIEGTGLSYYYSLANKFSDYFHASIPQISMNFPEYKSINQECEVAILIDNFNELPQALSDINNSKKRKELVENTLKAKEKFNWKTEEIKLINFYQRLASSK